MPWTDKDYIELSGLYVAYRKAKAEAFSDSNCAHGLKFADYEQNLSNNLRGLLRQLNRKRPAWPTDIAFIGESTCIPKSIVPAKPSDGSEPTMHCESSNPLDQWMKHFRLHGPADVEFRPVIDATVNYMIVSALWVLKVGHIYDEFLDTRHAMGNRLRRWRPKSERPAGMPGELNRISPNLFSPYFSAYGQWRNRGLRMMKTELKQGHRIAAITMDLKRFYHRIDASFLVHPEYLEPIQPWLSDDDLTFTRLLISSFSHWNQSTATKFGCHPTGIPVGLTASSVIANVLMRDFDSAVADRLSPSYYGRYVDDVILVLRQEEEYDDGETLLRGIAERLDPYLEFVDTPIDGKALKVNLPYHSTTPDSELLFVTAKQKIFQLEGAHGLDLINPIEEQIRSQGSEHRNLPSLPLTEGAMASRALLVSSDSQLQADALRKADAVSLRRSGFALLLSDVESHARDVEPKSWEDLRIHFYGVIERHLLTPQTFFDLSRYLPRIFSVMIQCQDWDRAHTLLDGIEKLLFTIRKTCGTLTPEQFLQMADARLTYGKRFSEVIFQNSSVPIADSRALLKQVRQTFRLPSSKPYSLKSIRENAAGLLKTDWAKQSYANHWLSSHTDQPKSPPRPRRADIIEVLPFQALDTFAIYSGSPNPYWPALAFPTRPTPLAQISTCAPGLIKEPQLFSMVVRGLRGIWMPEFPGFNIIPDPDSSKGPDRYWIPYDLPINPRIALTSLEITDAQWKASASGAPDLSLARYRNLHTLLNRTAKSNPKPDYVVLPELALPRRWVHSMVRKLLDRGISLIAGVEYREEAQNGSLVHNEAVIALRSTYPGYLTNFVVFQPKQSPAWKEGADLEKYHGKHFSNPSSGAPDRPVYVHDGFCFAVLNLQRTFRYRKSITLPRENRCTLCSGVESRRGHVFRAGRVGGSRHPRLHRTGQQPSLWRYQAARTDERKIQSRPHPCKGRTQRLLRCHRDRLRRPPSVPVESSTSHRRKPNI